MLFLVSAIHCGKNEYPVKVNIINGIRVVQNPQFPKFKDNGYSLEKVLTIGLEEGDNNYIFYKIRGIDVDSEGRIYVLDGGNHRIQVFDKDGKFLKTIGKKGQGPGELNKPTSISLGSDGKIFITEYLPAKITCFNFTDGKYINDFMLNEGALLSLQVDNNNLNVEVIKLRVQNNKPNEVLEIDKLNEFGDFIKKIEELNEPMKLQRSGNFYFASDYEPKFTWTVDLTGKIYTGIGNKYEISMYDTAGILNVKFGRIYKQARISSKEKNKELEKLPKHLRNKIKVPELKPVFDRIISDDNGNIWVHIFEKDKNGLEQFDVFNAEGIYLKKVILKDRPLLIKNGFAYAITKSKEGFDIIKKYKLEQTLLASEANSR